jgi:hypothetical protein
VRSSNAGLFDQLDDLVYDRLWLGVDFFRYQRRELLAVLGRHGELLALGIGEESSVPAPGS